MSAIAYDDLLSRNLALIQRVCKKTASEDSRFIEDLELDSIDLVGLVSEMEEEFGVFVPEERLRTFQTVGEATRCVQELLGAGEQVA
ncbi:MAG TPA: phosphopantetheine-binding protein [Thermoanaerobaculia bacterium]